MGSRISYRRPRAACQEVGVPEKGTHRRGLPAIALLLLILLGLGATEVLAQGTDWASPRSFATSIEARSLAAAHVDADEFADVVLVDGPLGSSAVSWYRGDGAGSLTFAGTIVSGILAFAVHLDDFDGDGDADLFVAESLSGGAGGRVSLYRNPGDGAFEHVGESLFAQPINSVATDDLDRDGVLDLLAGSWSSGHVYLLRGNGQGTFVPRRTLVAPVPLAPDPIRTADFNEDTWADVIIASGEVFVYLSDGAGGFAEPPLQIPSQFGSNEAAPADLDGDGHVDLVVRQFPGLALFFGDGTGNFTAGMTFEAGSASFRLADFDRDGSPDILAIDHDERARLLMNVGNGAFDIGPIHDSMGVGDFALADFNADDRIDIAAALQEEGVIVLGDPDGGIGLPSPVPVEAATLEFRHADFDGDSHLDLFVTDVCARRVQIALGDGAGNFGPLPPIDSGAPFPSSVAIGDLDQDGDVDVVVANSGLDCAPIIRAGNIAVFLNDGSAGLSRTNFTAGYRPVAVVVGDFTENGHLDIVAVSAEGESNPRSVWIFPGRGDGSFEAGIAFPLAHDPAHVVAADWNNDGHLDLAIAHEGGVSIRLGDGSGSFVESQVVSASPSKLLATADFNEDGFLDLLQSLGSGFRTAHGNGDGTFTLQPFVATADIAGLATAADTNEDGHVDVVATDLTNESVHLYAGDGSGSFSIEATFRGGSQPSFTLPADFDEDGHVDLLVGDSNSDTAPVRAIKNLTYNSILCRRGNVNAGAGPFANVVFVNGSPGDGADRLIRLAPDDPFELSVLLPPSQSSEARFLLHAWIGKPRAATTIRLPYDLGLMCRVPLMVDTDPRLRATFNNIGRIPKLGAPTDPSVPAPSTVVNAPTGVGREVRTFIQGIILDPAAMNGRAAVTNGIMVDVAGES